MDRRLSMSLAVLCLAGAAVAYSAALPSGAAADSPDARVARGHYLVEAVGCADCHAPKEFGPAGPVPDAARSLSGHRQQLEVAPAPAPEGPWIASTTGELTAWSGPWGVSFAANLTPDVETGLGGWSEEEFLATFRTGRTRGRGRELLPPMPIPAYRNFSDDDLRAIWAYLRTLPPVSNRVPQPLLPLGAN